ncbi:hypothetical protein JRC49_09515 [Clostridiales bacterium FE2011]|nr:hypothetical protein JRC49_09515 [Clostridiales bacterium FE2011]
MKKIDMKKTLNERAGNTEWTDENTWNVLRKIRNTKAERREYSLRRFVPAFMALLLVAGIGVAALTRTPGSPDPIRDKDLYTAQPIVTALAPGQGEGTDGLPEGDAGKAIRGQIRDYYPEIADQLKPINLSSEKDGIRLELISGAVKGDETWAVYSLQDVEGRYPEAVINGYADFDYMMGSVYTGESPLLYADEKEHKYYYCVRAQYEQPVDTNDRMVTFSMPFYEAECSAKLDMLELLKEHGTTGEGILSPELEPVYTAEGEVPRESKKVLDYTKPLDIPVLDNVKLTGIGWIDGSLHIQFHNPDAHGIGDRASNNWVVSMDYDSDYWTEDLFDGASWDENGDGASDWQEEILNCTPETLEKLKPVVNMTVTDNIVDGDWEIRFPLRTICADIEPAENEIDAEQAVIEAFRKYYPEVADQMRPINLSCEKDGIQLELVSGLVKDRESWMIYAVQDVEGKYSGSRLEGYCCLNASLSSYGGENPFLFADEKEHKYYYCDYTVYDGPVNKADRGLSVDMLHFYVERIVKLDAAPLLQEYGITSEGILSPELVPWISYDGPVIRREGVKVLDYTTPQLNIPVLDDVLLTGVGLVDGKIHAQFHNPNAHSIVSGETTFVDSNWWVLLACDDECQTEGLYETADWNEDKSGIMKWEELILNCSQEDLEKFHMQFEVTFTDAVVEGNWEVEVPLNLVCPDVEPAEKTATETDDEWRAEIKGRVHDFLTCWQQKELDDMLAMCTEPWRSERSLLNQILGKRIPEVWQVTDIKGEGWPVVTVGCEIRMQSEADAGFYFVKMKKEADGLWYFEPAGLGKGNSAYRVWFNMKDEDVILSSNETGSTVKAGEIPAFVSRINEFYTCWSKGDKDGMLALCPPDMRDTGYENFMIYLQSLPGTPLEWKIGQLYGKPEDDIRGAACEGIHRSPNGSKVMNLADIVVKKESDGQWYIIPASIDEIANSYAKTANGMAPLPEDEWHTTLSGRLDEFISCWQKKDKDGLLALCTTPWRSEWDKLNQLLENRTPKSWEIKWVKESGLPVVTVGCSISMQSEDEDGFFRFTAKKGTDGLWYFEPHKIWDTKITVDLPYSITDKDLILTGNEKGSQAKAEEIPPFVDSITDFLTLWNKGNTKGMLALCQPSMRNDERHVATVEFMVIDGYKPIEWKIGQLYGAPEEDARGAACELTIRKKNGQEILYPVDITATKEADGQWYISYMSIEQIMSDMLQAENKAAEEEYSSRNDPAREEIINCLNEFYSCWMNNDRDGMLARCVPAEDNRGTQSVMDYLLEFGQLKGFYPGEIRKTDNENTRSIHGSVSLRIPKGEDLAYYIDFEMKKADDGQWYIHPDVHLTLMNVVELQEATADGQETRKLAWPITVSMELGTSKLDKPGPIDVSVSVTNTSGNKLIESMILFDQTMTRIDEFGTAGLEAGETRTWSGKYTVTREQLNEGKIYFFLYFSEYNESTEEFESHTVSFYSPITRGEAAAQETASPAPAARSGKPVRVEMELGKEKLSGPETIDMTITVTNVSGDKLAGPVTLYDPDGNVVAEYSNEDFAAGETKEWTGKWTVTEEQLADGKVGFSVKYSDYKEGTQDVMAHKLNFSKEIRRE